MKRSFQKFLDFYSIIFKAQSFWNNLCVWIWVWCDRVEIQTQYLSTSLFNPWDSISNVYNLLTPTSAKKSRILRRFMRGHTSNIWNIFIISQNNNGYYTYAMNILSTWRHHRQKLMLDFSKNDAPGYSRFLDFFKIHG